MGLFDIVNNHTDEVKQELEEKIERALEAVGLHAEGRAKKLCTVDTGLLRNSITHALDGKEPAIKTYHASSGSSRGKGGKRKSAGSSGAGSVGIGRYSGAMPKEPSGERCVYIGTNVEYAPFIEKGTSRMAAKPFLRPAVEGGGRDFAKIIERYLKSD